MMSVVAETKYSRHYRTTLQSPLTTILPKRKVITRRLKAILQGSNKGLIFHLSKCEHSLVTAPEALNLFQRAMAEYRTARRWSLNHPANLTMLAALPEIITAIIDSVDLRNETLALLGELSGRLDDPILQQDVRDLLTNGFDPAAMLARFEQMMRSQSAAFN